jgi:hypothetical protein
MGNEVYANGREVACKAAAGKSICAMPDVCMTPPQTPATPPGVPIPYPNTGLASDTTEGSKNVKISGKEVTLKDKSYFKKSMGDEAGCAPMKGVVTHKNTGKVYFNAWSMDVKFEGENVVRHFDLTTHNHASVPGDTPTWPYVDNMHIVTWLLCLEDIAKEEKACKDFAPRNPAGKDPCVVADSSLVGDAKPGKTTVDSYSDKIRADECLRARRCQLQPYDKTEKGKGGCCRGQTGHHLVEASGFMIDRTSKNPGIMQGTTYDPDKAPCICVEGTNQYHGTHGQMHTHQSTAAINSATPGSVTMEFVKETLDGGETVKSMKVESPTTYGKARDQGVAAVKEVFPDSGCSAACLEAQLDAYHDQCGIKDDTNCKSVTTGHVGADWVQKAQEKTAEAVKRTSGVMG